MFVKAYLKGAERPDVLVVPQRAVRQGANGHEVWLANEKGQAEVRRSSWGTGSATTGSSPGV